VGPMIAALVKEKIGHKFHWAVADYLQRAARHLASKTDLEQAYAVGRAAVLLAVRGKSAVMPAIVRTSDKPYRWTIEAAPLDKVANREKQHPRDHIRSDGYGITAKARAYLSPLTRGEAFPPFRDGLPQYVRLKNIPVAKKLATSFAVCRNTAAPWSAARRRKPMTRSVEYLFTPVSPFTYLGHERFVAMAGRHGVSIDVKPIDLGPVFAVSGGLPLKQRAPQRQAYRLVELARWSKHLGLPL